MSHVHVEAVKSINNVVEETNQLSNDRRKEVITDRKRTTRSEGGLRISKKILIILIRHTASKSILQVAYFLFATIFHLLSSY